MFRVRLDHKDGALIMRLCLYKKRKRPVEGMEKRQLSLNQQENPHQDPDHAGTLISDFQFPKL